MVTREIVLTMASSDSGKGLQNQAVPMLDDKDKLACLLNNSLGYQIRN